MYKALWHLFRFKSCHIFECKHINYFVNTYLDLYIKMRIKSSSSSECDKYAYTIYTIQLTMINLIICMFVQTLNICLHSVSCKTKTYHKTSPQI
jgi:hypothetical protein